MQKAWRVPFEVVNDGEVTALAGSMSLNANRVLGIALGQPGRLGYVTQKGNITGWLNELAFVPVDLTAGAGRRVVGRRGLRRAVLFAAGGVPSRDRGGHRPR